MTPDLVTVAVILLLPPFPILMLTLLTLIVVKPMCALPMSHLLLPATDSLIDPFICSHATLARDRVSLICSSLQAWIAAGFLPLPPLQIP